jgi:hypothetical protein
MKMLILVFVKLSHKEVHEKEKMFLVKKFLCCFKIEIAGFVCVIDDVIISVLSCLFAVDMMKNAPYIKEHSDLEKPVKYLIFLYSTTELIAALLVFIALIKVNLIFHFSLGLF